jgi:hypothetical protein
MNPYNPLNNIPDNEDAYDSYDYEDYANYHLQKAAMALANIRQINPKLADLIDEFVKQNIMALNAYSHDMFQRNNPTNEDMLTRMRKNR